MKLWFWAALCVAIAHADAKEDREIVKNLEFFEQMEVIENAGMLSALDEDGEWEGLDNGEKGGGDE